MIICIFRFVAVFDGHGGKEVSKYARQRTEQYFNEILAQRMKITSAQLETTTQIPSDTDVIDAFKVTTRALDAEIGQKQVLNHQGSTFCGVFVSRLPSRLDLTSDVDGTIDKTASLNDKLSNTDAKVVSSSLGRDTQLTTFADYSIISCNIGDSRAILSRHGKAIDLTVDHKPDSPSEKARIEKLGGYVKWHGKW